MIGVAYPAINDDNLFNGPIPLPPAEEQQRIVARVDELMQLCDQLEALEADKRAARAEALRVSLARLLDAPDAATSRARWGCLSAHWPELLDTPASVAPLRQTILGLAVRGQLVPQDDADEPASHSVKANRGGESAFGRRQETQEIAAAPANRRRRNAIRVAGKLGLGSIGRNRRLGRGRYS